MRFTSPADTPPHRPRYRRGGSVRRCQSPIFITHTAGRNTHRHGTHFTREATLASWARRPVFLLCAAFCSSRTSHNPQRTRERARQQKRCKERETERQTNRETDTHRKRDTERERRHSVRNGQKTSQRSSRQSQHSTLRYISPGMVAAAVVACS